MQQNQPLRPLTFLELLDRTFRIYRESFVPCVAMAFLVVLPLSIFSQVAVTSWSSYSTATLTASSSRAYSDALNASIVQLYLMLFAVYTVSYFVQGMLLNGIVTYIASEKHLGHTVTLRDAFRAVRSRWKVLGLGLLRVYVVIIAIAIGLVFALCLLGLGIGAIVYIGIASYAFLTPVLILERTNVSDGVGRAWNLGKARFWSILRIMLAISGVTYLWSFSILLLAQALAPGQATVGSTQPGQILLNILINIVFAPLLPIAFTLMYYDARVRVEGLDILLGATDNPDMRPADVVSPQPERWRLVGRDFMNIMILCVGSIVLVGLIFGAFMAVFTALVRS
jgi:hypothetical protein